MLLLDDRTLKAAINFYGDDSQIDMAIEEMAELTKAICKYRRYHTEESRVNIIEECADVLITALQMRLIFGSDDVDKMFTEKLCRLQERIKSDEDRAR